MPMYNLLQYSCNYSMAPGSLWNYHRDEINDSANEINDNDNMINVNKTTTSKSFEYKTKIIGSTSNNNNKLNAKVNVPLIYLRNFWRSFGLLLINCEINITWLEMKKKYAISQISRTVKSS